MTGASFIHAIHIRGATGNTWTRSAGGDRNPPSSVTHAGGSSSGCAIEHGGHAEVGAEKWAATEAAVRKTFVTALKLPEQLEKSSQSD